MKVRVLIGLGGVEARAARSDSAALLAEHWSEVAESRWISGGHCSTVGVHKPTVINAVLEVFGDTKL